MTDPRPPRRHYSVPDPQNPDILVYTIRQLARKLGIDRSTLIRMEQKGQIMKARWAPKPIDGRVYTEEDVAIVMKQIEEHRSRKVNMAEGRELLKNGSFKVASIPQ